MAQPVNKGILQYWPQIFGIASFVFTAGVVYGKFGQMDEKQKNSELRQDRQFELYQVLERRMIEQEKSREYYKGVRDGRSEAQGIKKAE
jgi:hypothetical protein